MNFSNEKLIDLWIVNGESRSPATLYVRFEPNGVGAYLTLNSRDLQIQISQVDGRVPNNFLEALEEGLLPQLPPQTYLELQHTMDVVSSGITIGAVRVEERIHGRTSKDQNYAIFDLAMDLDGKKITTSPCDDIYYPFRELSIKIDGWCKVCAHCKYARIVDYGGDDLRHGFYCFRDNPDAFAVVASKEWRGIKSEGDPLVWAQQSWSNVDAFHSCPSFDAGDGRPDEL